MRLPEHPPSLSAPSVRPSAPIPAPDPRPGSRPGRLRAALVAACSILLLQAPAAVLARAAPAAGAAHAAPTRATQPASTLLERALDDVRELTGPRMNGRATGTDGGRLGREHVKKRFADIGLAPLGDDYLQRFRFSLRDGRKFDDAANVLGMLRGRESPDRWLVISAHYDHLGEVDGRVYPGADDNASGVGALLAIAAHFRAHPPRHSILFASFDAEELGIRGAREFVERPVVPLGHIAAVLNLDMVSASTRNEIYMAGTYHRPWLKPLIEEAANRSKVTVRFGHDAPPVGGNTAQDWTMSSDHGPFHLKGIPFVYFGVEDHPHYHQPTDTFANFNRDFYARVLPLLIDVAGVMDRELGKIARQAGR